jgi:hypothetical protein
MLEYEEPALSILAGQKNIKKVEKSESQDLPKITEASIVQRGNKKKVAVFSERNMTWQDVGKVYRGVNLVEETLALKWLSRPTVRLATEKEIMKEFK